MSPFEWRPPLGYNMTAFNLVILWMLIGKLNLGGFSLDESRVPSYTGIQLIEGDRITFQTILTHNQFPLSSLRTSPLPHHATLPFYRPVF
ncbi:hypothetical protein D9613_012192 [Agrocybe pediades]|uniref:Uncharacterized protein n=1 Tax=Agrocybe pediades TaxID=84607 RepID=A0A8H4R2W4_9AGAR|nr:hypothetical protein D9613_012192 [Agrocybe pediades]